MIAWLLSLAIAIDAPRPLAALADELESRYPIVVTYEDCACVPEKMTITFTHAEGSVGVQELLEAMLVQYHDANPPARFRVEGGKGRYHLIPANTKTVLDTPVRLTDEERTVDETLDETMAQLNIASSNSVEWGFTPLNLFHQKRIRVAADGEPAREVLRRILAQMPQRITWRLNYEPMGKRYILNILVRPNASPA